MFTKLFNTIKGLFVGQTQVTEEETKGWSDQQVKELIEMYIACKTKEEMQEQTGRSLNSINYKLINLFGTSKVKKA